jgi:hypothetical protein
VLARFHRRSTLRKEICQSIDSCECLDLQGENRSWRKNKTVKVVIVIR